MNQNFDLDQGITKIDDGTLQVNGNLNWNGASPLYEPDWNLVLDDGTITVGGNLNKDNSHNWEIGILHEDTLTVSGNFNQIDYHISEEEGFPGIVRMGMSATVSITGTYAVKGGYLAFKDHVAVEIGTLEVFFGAVTWFFEDVQITGNVVNHGQILSGLTGLVHTLEIVGNYTQTATGALRLHYGLSDYVNVSGLATLTGGLVIDFMEGPPAVGTTIRPFRWGTRSGAFVININPGIWEALYDDTSGSLFLTRVS